MQTKNLICFGCKHWREIGRGCNAFPDGIPELVLMTNKHDKPLPLQNNELVYEKIKTKANDSSTGTR